MTPRSTTQTTTCRVGLYARISKDDGTALGIARQLKGGTAFAHQRGATAITEYVDNDVSATRSKVRPAFERLMADVRAGKLDAIVCYDLDRLTRSPDETETIITACQVRSVQLWPMTGAIDLEQADGMLQMRLKGAISRHSTDQMSRRLRDKMLQKAEAGEPHSPVAYGYRRVAVRDANDRKLSSHDEINEYEARVVRFAASRVLIGLSLRSTAAELNHPTAPEALTLNGGQPVAPPRKAQGWSSAALRDILTRERNAGRRIHRGKVIGAAAWPAIYTLADGTPDADFHDRVVAVLTAPERQTNYNGSTRKHLMTGLLVCGKCGSTEVAAKKQSAGGANIYVCRSGCTSRRQEPVDQAVRAIMVRWLADPEALTSLATGDTDELAAAKAEKAACKAKIARAIDAFGDADDPDSIADVARLRARMRTRIQAAEAIIAANLPATLPTDLPGATAELKWDNAPLEVQRELVRLTMTVTLLPTRSGRRPFDPSSLGIDQKVAL